MQTLCKTPPIAAAHWPVADLRCYLAGAWMMTRLIEDRRQGTRGSFLGWAWFTECEGGLDYRERGQMLLPGYRGVATQGYRYCLEAPGRATVRFRDGRVFHDLDLTAGAWQAEHLCGQDLYRGSFAAQGDDHWSVTWRVSGPRKDLLLLSRFLRYRPDKS
ncbi:MAG: DUF6314 family protein [Kiloniellales bacterium]